MAKVSKRLRRSADEARRQILDAAEELLSRFGPAGLRLQDVAKNVGVSHPTVLHHFGSRGGLVEAVIERSVENVYDDLVAGVQHYDQMEPRDVLTNLYERISCAGHTRVIAWLILSNHDFLSGAGRVRRITELVHGMRVARWEHEDRPVPPFEDTLFMVMLVSLVFFGDEIAGQALLREAGIEDTEGARGRFRQWLSELVIAHLKGQPSPRAGETAEPEPSSVQEAGMQGRAENVAEDASVETPAVANEE